MKIEEACNTWLFDEYHKNAISRKDLLSKFLRIWLDKEYKGEQISNISNARKALRTFDRFCRFLLKKGRVRGEKWGAKGFRYFIVHRETEDSIEKTLSAIYPIGYIGYISAIKHYNLVPIKSNSVYFVTVNRADWKRLCIKNIYNTFPELETNKGFFDDFFENIYIEDLIPVYPVEETMDNFQIIIVNQKKLSPSELWNEVRVESLPHLYIDMLRNPKYCGGLGQVLHIYNTMNKDIFKEVVRILDRDSRSSNMDRARFGFIFEKILKLNNEVFIKWKTEQMFKRGGTRKLVSYLPFEPTYDEQWNISINYDLAKPYASSNDK